MNHLRKSVPCLAILLLVLIVLSLSVFGCGSKPITNQDLNGTWNGTVNITYVNQKLIDSMFAGCGGSGSSSSSSSSVSSQLSKPIPVVMDIKATSDSAGTITFSQKGESQDQSSQKPVSYTYSNGKLSVDFSDQGVEEQVSANVKEASGGLAMDGTLKVIVTKENQTLLSGAFTATK
jgi:hypothetical protein